jgi:hypothetical protein
MLTEMPPRNTRSVVLNQPVPCSPCRQFRCPFHQECLDLPPEAVVEAALRLTERVATP